MHGNLETSMGDVVLHSCEDVQVLANFLNRLGPCKFAAWHLVCAYAMNW